MNDQTLAPTLWKTCRVLANQVRLDLLRILLEAEGGETIENIAKKAKIGRTSCGLYLKQLQARGLCSVRRVSRYAYYSVQVDPLVKQAGVLLPALIQTLKKYPNGQIFHMLTAFTHVRRIKIVESLMRKSPQEEESLILDTGVSRPAFGRHIEKLSSRHIVRQNEQMKWTLCEMDNPLSQALMEFIRMRAFRK